MIPEYIVPARREFDDLLVCALAFSFSSLAEEIKLSTLFVTVLSFTALLLTADALSA